MQTESKPLLRVRFSTPSEDYRPVKWPIKWPYWCTGYGAKGSTIVAYTEDMDYICENWPEVTPGMVDVEVVHEVTFSSRFPRPDWFTDSHGFPVKVLP